MSIANQHEGRRSSMLNDASNLLTRTSLKIGSRDWHIWCVENQDALLELPLESDDPPYGLLLWESAVALAQELQHCPEVLAGRRVLELGAGVGLPGLVACSLGAQVLQTDKAAEALRLAALNEQENGLSGVQRALADWTRWGLLHKYDVIIGADILYETAMHPALAAIFENCIAHDGTVILADPGRPQALAFLGALELKGARFELSIRSVPPTCPLGSRETAQVLLARWRPQRWSCGMEPVQELRV